MIFWYMTCYHQGQREGIENSFLFTVILNVQILLQGFSQQARVGNQQCCFWITSFNHAPPPQFFSTSQHIQHTKQNICCSAPYPLSFQLCDVPWSTSKALDRFLASSHRVHLSSSFKHNEICVWRRFRPKVSSGGCQTKSSKCARRLLSTSFMALTLHVFRMRLTHFRCWNLEMTQVLHKKNGACAI